MQTLEFWEQKNEDLWINTECITIEEQIIDHDRFSEFLTGMIIFYLENQDEELESQVDNLLTQIKNEHRDIS